MHQAASTVYLAATVYIVSQELREKCNWGSTISYKFVWFALVLLGTEQCTQQPCCSSACCVTWLVQSGPGGARFTANRADNYRLRLVLTKWTVRHGHNAIWPISARSIVAWLIGGLCRRGSRGTARWSVVSSQAGLSPFRPTCCFSLLSSCRGRHGLPTHCLACHACSHHPRALLPPHAWLRALPRLHRCPCTVRSLNHRYGRTALLPLCAVTPCFVFPDCADSTPPWSVGSSPSTSGLFVVALRLVV